MPACFLERTLINAKLQWKLSLWAAPPLLGGFIMLDLIEVNNQSHPLPWEAWLSSEQQH